MQCEKKMSSYPKFTFFSEEKLVAPWKLPSIVLVDNFFLCKGHLNKVHLPDLGRSSQQITFKTKS